MSIASSEAYRWQPSTANPTRYQRRMLGIELLTHNENVHLDGHHTIVFGVDCALAAPLALPALVAVMRRAWITLRFAVPTIAVRTAQDEAGPPIFVYHTAADQAEVEAWAERTVKPMNPSVKSYMDAHAHLAQLLVPDVCGDGTFLHVVARTATECTLILHAQHAPFDGSSLKHIMSRLLSIVARYIQDGTIAEREHAELRWGAEATNLCPAWSEIVAEHEVVAGQLYDKTLYDIMQDTMRILSRAHGYRSRSSDKAPNLACHVWHQFTEEQTSCILRFCKGKAVTVNQLVHAAVFLSTLRDNPAPSDDAVFGCLCLINLRSRLRPPFSDRRGYLGSCIALFPLSTRVVDVARVDVDEQLGVLSVLLKKEYEQQKARVGLLGTSDAVLSQLAAASQAQPLPVMTGAWFVGDGIGENDMDSDFEDGVVRVTDFHVAIRQVDPAPCFRAHSWRGRLTLAVDYNGAFWARNTIKELMAHILTDLAHTYLG